MREHGDDHGHSHGHAEGQTDDRRALAIALALILAFLVAEVVAALVAGSLALLADAGHMLTDAGALAFALFAATLARRPAQGRGPSATSGSRSLRRRRTASRCSSSRC